MNNKTTIFFVQIAQGFFRMYVCLNLYFILTHLTGFPVGLRSPIVTAKIGE